MEDYCQELYHLEQLYKANEYEKALEKAQALFNKYTNNIEVNIHLEGIVSIIYIEAGEATKNIEIIDQGISIHEQLLERLDNLETNEKEEVFNYKNQLIFNLSRGYLIKSELSNSNNNKLEYNNALSNAKKYAQSLLLIQNDLDPELLVKVINNYAQMLSTLGRYIEAIDYYYDCLKINPDFPISMGNLAFALNPLGSLRAKYKMIILFEIWRLLSKAVESSEGLIDISGLDSLDSFNRYLSEVEEYIDIVFEQGLDELKHLMKEAKEKQDFKPSPYLKFICDKRLLLTVNPKPLNYQDEYRDDLCFEKIITSESHLKKFRKLAHAFNQIKEEFSTARHLYYQSFSQDTELIEVSKITEYIDTLDSGDFGLRNGFLKTSLRLAVDVLEKIAGFLYEYFYDDLDLTTPKKLKPETIQFVSFQFLYWNMCKSDKIFTLSLFWVTIFQKSEYVRYHYYKNDATFNKFWYVNCSRIADKKTKQENLHPIIDKKLENNPYLRALFELKKDLYIESENEKPFNKPFDTKDHFYPFRILRNSLTHTGITLHQNGFTDELKENYSLEQMQEETYFLLRMVKAAIIYLVGVVMIEEKEREKSIKQNNQKIPSDYFDTSPGLSDQNIDHPLIISDEE